MIPQHIKSRMIEAGVKFAETEDVVKAVMRIATDSFVNGESFHLSMTMTRHRLTIMWRKKGRSLGALSRDQAAEGYIDLDSDDYLEDGFIYPMGQWRCQSSSGKNSRADRMVNLVH